MYKQTLPLFLCIFLSACDLIDYHPYDGRLTISERDINDHKLPAGAAKSGIQTPTISSTTTREGSSPQIGSTAFAERMPAIVKIPINNAVIIRSRVGDTAHDNASQISVANKAPAVPGANGEKPEPKPVAIII